MKSNNQYKILILGGTGLVGSAISHRILNEGVKKLSICGLGTTRDKRAVRKLRHEYPRADISSFWGDILLRTKHKDKTSREIENETSLKESLISDIYSPLHEEIVSNSFLHKLINRVKPDVVIDCVNMSTYLSYSDSYRKAMVLDRIVSNGVNNRHNDLAGSIYSYIYTQELPRLIRHIQILYESMRRNLKRRQFKEGVQIYIKVGTTGTGGMGFNIPYTHGEEKPSSQLLLKAAVAGAHTSLLYSLSQTPDAPVTKEIKPATAIAWGEINYGAIYEDGETIRLQDCHPKKAYNLKDNFDLSTHVPSLIGRKKLKSVYLDSGENGLFSLEEFKAITSLRQMEFITPEEIADVVIKEMNGLATGKDVLSSMSNSFLKPSYRAAYLRNAAIARMKELERTYGVDSVAFEILGPPRLSKLLFEAALIKKIYKTMDKFIKDSPNRTVKKLEEFIVNNQEIRSQIISVGIPVLLRDGDKILVGSFVKIPDLNNRQVKVKTNSINVWANQGWVDLRVKNIKQWQNRFIRILKEIKTSESAIKKDLSSRLDRRFYSPSSWEIDNSIDVGEIVAWVFEREEGGFKY